MHSMELDILVLYKNLNYINFIIFKFLMYLLIIEYFTTNNKVS